MYAKIRAWGGLFILIIFFISALYCLFSTYNKYEPGKNGQTTYKQKINDNYEICNSTDISNTNCLFYTEYDDINNNHYMVPIQNVDKTKRLVGSSPIYYEKNNPNNYVNTPISPVNIASIISCILCILIIITIIYVYLLSRYDGLATVQGGIDATSSIASIFNKK